MSKSERRATHHAVLLGEWGVGKTVLLKQFKAVAQAKGIPAFLCEISRFPENSTVEAGLELLAGLMVRRSSRSAQIAEALKEVDITITIPGISAKRTNRRIHPQIYLASFLETMWGYLKAPAAVVLVDDVHNFASIASVLDVIRAVLSDDNVKSKTNWLFVVSCMPHEWDAFLHKHHPIGRVFRERQVLNKLEAKEVEEVISGSLKGTGVRFEKDVIERICDVTQGHPYELQTLCDNLYTNQIRGIVDISVWETSLQQTLDQLGEAYFKAACIGVSDREIPVLKTLAESLSDMSIKEIQDELAKRKDMEFPVQDTKTYVYRLVKERRLVEKVARGRYQVSDRMLSEYVSHRIPFPE